MPEQNPIIPMRRKHLPEISSQHAGLLLDKGFYKWAKKEGKDEDGKLIPQHNKAAQQLHIKASNIDYSELYKKAYDNWQKVHSKNCTNSKVWFGKLENRLYLGMGEASPLEAGITLHQTYGTPFIPGSAIKGVLHHYAVQIGLSNEIKEVLFGEKVSAENQNGSAAYLIYNDAWWVPEEKEKEKEKEKALAPEVITVHAPKYYGDKGKDFIHPDFESPNPNPQIAIQGSFLFSIEGDAKWAEYAIQLLSKVLKENGIGGKTASGYGYFYNEDEKKAEEIEKHNKKQLQDAILRKSVYLKMNTKNGSFHIELGAERNIATASSSNQKKAIINSLNETQLQFLRKGEGIKIDALINGQNLLKVL